MNFSIAKFFKASLVAGLTLAGTAAQAQTGTTSQAPSRIGEAVQQGRGAYVQKNTRNECITNDLLGLKSGTVSCLDMVQTKFLVTPSGNAMSVWRGTAPAGARPARQQVYNSTHTEVAANTTRQISYTTSAVTQPDGTVTLTLTSKGNGAGSNDAPSQGGMGRGRGKSKN